MALRSRIDAIVSSIISVHPHEIPPLIPSSSCFFLLRAYFVIPPLRDDGAIFLGLSNLPGLFVRSLVLTLVAAPDEGLPRAVNSSRNGEVNYFSGDTTVDSGTIIPQTDQDKIMNPSFIIPYEDTEIPDNGNTIAEPGTIIPQGHQVFTTIKNGNNIPHADKGIKLFGTYMIPGLLLLEWKTEIVPGMRDDNADYETPRQMNCGPWSPDEDLRLKAALQHYGRGNWTAIAGVVGSRTNSQAKSRANHLYNKGQLFD